MIVLTRRMAAPTLEIAALKPKYSINRNVHPRAAELR
jgi:hypothetical protein